MIKIPLFNAPIGDSGFSFTPDEFPRWLAYIAPQIEALQAGGSGALDADIVGSGRLARADYFGADATAPRVPSSPALAIEIPNGQWFVEGHKIQLDEVGGFLAVAGVPANASKYGYLSSRFIEELDEWTLTIEPQHWFDALQPDLSAAGLACVGKVTSDFESVTAIDGANADVIWPLPLIQKRLREIVGNEDEDVTGAVSAAQFNALKARFDVLALKFAELENKTNEGAVITIRETPSNLIINSGKLIAEVANLNPTSSRQFIAGVDMPGKTGDAQDWNGVAAPVVRIGGNADYSNEDEVIRP